MVACIGPATAKTAEEHGLRVDVLAAEAERRAPWSRRSPSTAPACAGARREAGEPVVRPSRAQGPAAAAQGAAEPWRFPTERPAPPAPTPALRRLVAETRLHPAELVLPVFVREGASEPVADLAMPGVVQHSLESLRKVAAAARVEAGLGGLMLFGVPGDQGRARLRRRRPGRHPQRRAARLHAEVGDDLVVMADLCLDEFTDHGHCGVLAADGSVDNDATLERYAAMALAQADAGAHVVGPVRDDGRPGRRRPRGAGRRRATDTVVLAYAAKYASGASTGRSARRSSRSLVGDRRDLPAGPGQRPRGAARGRLDIAEGADMVMVKPALAVPRRRRGRGADVDVPVAAYQVSGEYSMIEAAAQRGWIDRERAMMEC